MVLWDHGPGENRMYGWRVTFLVSEATGGDNQKNGAEGNRHPISDAEGTPQ
jgi:hypothetical protein